MANEIEIVVTTSDRSAPGIDSAKRRAEALGRTNPTIKVDADTAKADAKMEEANRKRRRLDGSRANVNVDADVARALGKIALVTAAIAGLSTVGVAGIGAVAGLGAVGGAGLGALAAGFSGIGGAVEALGKHASGAGGGAASTGRAVYQANEQVARSEHDLMIAQRDARQAQVDLNDAREQAAEDLQDLATKTADMHLSEKQAALDVEQALVDLNTAKADPRATDLQRRQAQLAYDEALQQQKDLSIQAKRLAEDKAEADKKGVAGSDLVVQANQRVKDSTYQVAQAQLAVKDAHMAVADAHKGSGGGAAKQADTLAAAMAKLSPAGQEFARFLRGFIDGPLKQLRFAGQDGLLPGLERGLKAIEPMLKAVTPAFREFSSVLGNALAGAMVALTPLIPSFLKLATVGLKALAPLGPVLAAFADAFGKMVEKVTKDGSLDKAMEGLVLVFQALLMALPQLIPLGLQLMATLGGPLGDALAALIPAIAALAVAMLPVLVKVLQTLVPILNWLTKEITKHPKLFAAITTAVIVVAGAISLLGPLIGPVVAAFSLLGGTGVAVIGALIAWILTAIEVWHRFRDAIRTAGRIWDNVKNAAKTAKDFIIRQFQAVVDFIKNIPSKIGKGAGSFFGNLLSNADPRNWMAHGGIVGAAGGGARGGLVMVGEQGRELVRLPYGSTVIPHGGTEGMLAAGARTGGGGRIVLELQGEEALVQLFRRIVRVRGGSVQAVLGR